DHAFRLLIVDKAGGGDRVAADIHQAAPTDLVFIADVVGVAVEVAEVTYDRAELPYPPRSHQFAGAQPLRVRPDHEGFANFDARPFLHALQLVRFSDAYPEGLLAKDMLARFCRLDRPGHMHVIGEGVVDGLYVRIAQQLLIRGVGLGYAQSQCGFFGLGLLARGNGADVAPLTFLHGGDGEPKRELRCAEHSPTNFIWHDRVS